MLKRCLADAALVFSWFVADCGYGRDPVLRQFCHDNQLSYVLAVPVDLPLLDVYGKPLRPDVVLANTPDTAWERRSAGDGSKGKRFYDWAAHTVTVKDQPAAKGYEHTLLIRRATTPKVTTKHPEGIYEVEYFLLCFAPMRRLRRRPGRSHAVSRGHCDLGGQRKVWQR
jgi:hypothetical protein